MTKNNRKALKAINTAGAIFFGPCTPTVVDDYLRGPITSCRRAAPGRRSPD